MVRPNTGTATARPSRPTTSTLLSSRSTKQQLLTSRTNRPFTTTTTTLTFTSTPATPNPSRLLSTHRSLLQLRTDIAQLTHSDTLLKTKIRQVEKRLTQCKALHAQLALLPNLPPATTTTPPPTPPAIAALLTRKRALTASIHSLQSLAVTHEALVEQIEAEGRELIGLHSDWERLKVEQRRREREREEQKRDGKEMVGRLRVERDEWVDRGEVMRAECVRVEEELEKEEMRQRQLQRAVEEKTTAVSRSQRIR